MSASLKAKEAYDKEARSERKQKKRKDDRMESIGLLSRANGIPPMMPLPTAFLGQRSNTAMNYQEMQNHQAMAIQQQALGPLFQQMFAPMIGNIASPYGAMFPTTPTASVTPVTNAGLSTGHTSGTSFFPTQSGIAARTEPETNDQINLSDSLSEDDIFNSMTSRTLDMLSVSAEKKTCDGHDEDLPSSQPSNVSDNED